MTTATLDGLDLYHLAKRDRNASKTIQKWMITTA
jgi:hypothetical protein